MKINLDTVTKQGKEYEIHQQYNTDLILSNLQLNDLPDLQNGDLIKGSKVHIERVGISNFRLPLKVLRKGGGFNILDVSVVGTVSLEGVKKGINMSRILRSFYHYKNDIFTIDKLKEILLDYREKLGSYDAHLLLTFKYRMWQKSLRSVNEYGEKNGGWQYYNVTLESKLSGDKDIENTLHFDFVYSSACPCSTELSLHSMDNFGLYAIPHSQRSVARVSIKTRENFWIEDLHQLCQNALKTETVVFCKREDEQAFAELNAANTKFVEDAVRLLYEQLDKESKILDFKIVASHNESLHSHDAIAVIVKGIPGGFDEFVSVADFKTLVY